MDSVATVDPSSTTTISLRGQVWASADRIVSTIHSEALNAGMRMETSGVMPWPSRFEGRSDHLQAPLASLQGGRHVQARDLEHPVPPMGPVVPQQRVAHVAATELAEAIGLDHQGAEDIGDVGAVGADRHDGVRPIEQVPERSAVGRLTDHHRPGGQSFVVAEADLNLSPRLLLRIHLARRHDEEAAPLRGAGVQIAMLSVIGRVAVAGLQRVVHVEQALARGVVQQRLVDLGPPPAHAVDVDDAVGWIRVWTEPERVHAPRHEIAVPLDGLAEWGGGALQPYDDVIETP